MGVVQILRWRGRRPAILLIVSIAAALVGVITVAHAGSVSVAGEEGRIAGVASAPDGSLLAGVTVVIEGEAIRDELVTGDGGIYRSRGLPAGDYRVSARLAGFEAVEREAVAVLEGRTTVLDLKLQLLHPAESITVTRELARDTLESAQIRESAARDLGEALTRLAGVWKVRRGAIGNDVVVNGYQGPNLPVLIDGLRIYGACPNRMDPSASHVDFAEVDRVEVVKGGREIGPAGSLGGVVHIHTRRPESGLHLIPTVTAGSDGLLNPSLLASWGGGGESADRWGLTGGYSYRRSDPYRDGSGRDFIDYANYNDVGRTLDAYRIGTAWIKGETVASGRHHLRAAWTRQEAREVLYPYLLMDAVTDDADRVTVGYDRSLPGAHQPDLTAQLSFSRVDHWMSDGWRTSSSGYPGEYRMGTQAQTWTADAQVHLRSGPLVLGMEFFRRAWDAQTRLSGPAALPQSSLPDVRQDSLSMLGDVTRRIAERASIFIGGRIEYGRSSADEGRAATALYDAYQLTRDTRRSDALFSGRARIEYEPAPGLELGVCGASTQRLPDPQELYFALRRMGTDWVGNPGLESPRSNSVEATAELRRSGLRLMASVHHDWVADFITLYDQSRQKPEPGVANDSARSYGNVDARIYGGELSLSVTPLPRLFLAASTSYVRGTKSPRNGLNLDSSNLAEIPPIRARASVRYDTGKLMGEIEADVAGAQNDVDTDLQESPTPGFAVFNARVALRLSALSAGIVVSNLFDRYYVEHLSYQRDPFRSGVRVPEPGRNVQVSVSYKY